MAATGGVAGPRHSAHYGHDTGKGRRMMGLSGWIEGIAKEAECLAFGHSYNERGVCLHCGKRERR